MQLQSRRKTDIRSDKVRLCTLALLFLALPVLLHGWPSCSLCFQRLSWLTHANRLQAGHSQCCLLHVPSVCIANAPKHLLLLLLLDLMAVLLSLPCRVCPAFQGSWWASSWGSKCSELLPAPLAYLPFCTTGNSMPSFVYTIAAAHSETQRAETC